LVLDLLLIGLAITLEPFPLIAFILILSTERGIAKAAAFLLGWIASLVAVIAGVTLATGGQPPAAQTAPSTAADVAKIVIGLILVGYGVWKWRHRGRPRKPPSWMGKLDRMSNWAAALLSVFLQPWMLVAAGAATVVQANMSGWQTYLALAGFCVVASASFLAMELLSVLAPEAAADRLDRIRAWLDSHQEAMIILVSVLIGCWLAGKSSYYLVTA
jgi:hypothetical protein